MKLLIKSKKLISKEFIDITHVMILLISSKMGSERSRKLFFICNYTKLFWSQISLFIVELFYTFIDINYIMVLFLDCDTGLVEIDNTIKMCVKYHIHKAKCMLNVPIFH